MLNGTVEVVKSFMINESVLYNSSLLCKINYYYFNLYKL